MEKWKEERITVRLYGTWSSIKFLKNEDWEDKVRQSLEATIIKYEPRLKDVHVRVELTEVEEDVRDKFPNARKRVRLWVSGLIVRNDQHFNFNTHLYISPISQ